MHNRNKTSRGQQQPLISLTIELGNNKSDRIALYRHTDPYLEAKQFVQRNHLSQNMIKIISSSIIKQMKAYDEIMMITYDTQTETNYLRNLKQNHLELQNKLKTPSPKKYNYSPQQKHKPTLSKSPSNVQIFDDLPTDKVVVKKLFQVLDSDQDGLISANKVSYNKVPTQLRNKIHANLEQKLIPLEFEELYEKLRQDSQEEYFITLRWISEIFEIQKIKVLL